MATTQGRHAPSAHVRAEPSETLYIHNLNERVKVPVMKQTLEALFGLYGKVLSVVAHANLRMRGQAFVSFKNKEIATKAMKEVQDFPLYGKAMRIAFARTKSDSVVQHVSGPPGSTEAETALEVFQKQRKEQKQITRRTNIHRYREMLRRQKETRGMYALHCLPTEGVPAPGTMARKATSLARVQANQLPDEYLPPNKILFLQQIPNYIAEKELKELFGAYPNLNEVRMVPGKGDIAFIEYNDIPSGVTAREATNGHAFPNGERLKVSYSRA